MVESKDYKDIRGVIFDYGGTLDSGGNHWAWVIYDAYTKAGLTIDIDKFIDAYVFAERELARTRHILPEHTFGDLMRIKIDIEMGWLVENGVITPEDKQRYSRGVADECYAFARRHVEEAKKVLNELAKKYPMVLVSNFYGNVESVLTDFGIAKYFKAIIESAVVGVRKPDPAIFTLGVEALRLPADEVVVVGDSLRKDILPAEKAGCKVLWIKGRGFNADEDSQTHPAIVKDLTEVYEILK